MFVVICLFYNVMHFLFCRFGRDFVPSQVGGGLQCSAKLDGRGAGSWFCMRPVPLRERSLLLDSGICCRGFGLQFSSRV